MNHMGIFLGVCFVKCGPRVHNVHGRLFADSRVHSSFEFGENNKPVCNKIQIK